MLTVTATIPVTPNAKKPPLVKWEEFQHRHPTAEECAAWARRFPGANQLLVTGTISGIVVLDVDPRHGGDQSIRDKHLPPTRTIRTPGSGTHYYYTLPGFQVPCVGGLLPGVDVKGEGGYVLVPPSSIDGRAYELIMDEPIAAMPAWLLELVKQHRTRNGEASLDETEMAQLLRGVPEGSRDATATRLAGHLLAKKLSAGARVSVPSVATIADGLRVQQPGVLTWEITCRCVDGFVAVDDESTLDAVRRLYLDAHLVVEPSGAVPVAALLAGSVAVRPALAVVSGGNLDPNLLSTLLSRAS